MELSNQTLYQGDTWSWEEELSDYPASTHTLKLYLKLSTNETIELTASADVDTHVFSYSAANSANASPGIYSYQFKAVKISDSSVTTVEVGSIEVLPDINTITDERSWIQQAIDSIESVLPTALAREAGEISIAGRTIKYESKAELIKTYNNLKYMLKKEQQKERVKAGFDAGNAIKVEFR